MTLDSHNAFTVTVALLSVLWKYIYDYHARIQSFFQRGPTLTTLFLVDEWIQIPLKCAIIGPPAKRHLNDVYLRANDGPTLNTGLVAL